VFVLLISILLCVSVSLMLSPMFKIILAAKHRILRVIVPVSKHLLIVRLLDLCKLLVHEPANNLINLSIMAD